MPVTLVVVGFPWERGRLQKDVAPEGLGDAGAHRARSIAAAQHVLGASHTGPAA